MSDVEDLSNLKINNLVLDLDIETQIIFYDFSYLWL